MSRAGRSRPGSSRLSSTIYMDCGIIVVTNFIRCSGDIAESIFSITGGIIELIFEPIIFRMSFMCVGFRIRSGQTLVGLGVG